MEHKINPEKEMNKENFCRWLNCMQKELNFSQSELARQAGVSTTTIGRYLRGETLPDKITRDKIRRYIDNLCFIGNFRYIRRKEFTDLLNELIDTFKITQSEISRMTGISQPYISDYTHHDSNRHISTKDQYDILNFFLEYAYAGMDRFLPEYKEIGKRLEQILCAPEKPPRPARHIIFSDFDTVVYAGDYDPHCEQWYISANKYTISRFVELPIEIKRLIIENEAAFFWGDRFFSSEMLDHLGYKMVINHFKNIDSYYYQRMLEQLEYNSKIVYRPGYNDSFYSIVCQFHRLISMADKVPKLMKKKDKRCNEDDQLDHKFKALILNDFNIEAVFWEDFEFRLNMSSFDWYYIMLLVIYQYNGYSLCDFYTEMDNYTNSPPLMPH